ncbi:unnamed protein product [Staurois parvus]|uniref:Secreted protein n=1 Tax=Staurois parvus TaxID=386267 RepID=A0ABN9GJ25_9NEOB|nr:unnamed protein product [Staurois parvus]
MDSALVVGLTCRVGCSTRADQRVLSAARSSLLQSANTWGCLQQEWTQHWWWDSPAVWAAVPGLTSGCSQQPEAHFCSQPTPGAVYSRCI